MGAPDTYIRTCEHAGMDQAFGNKPLHALVAFKALLIYTYVGSCVGMIYIHIHASLYWEYDNTGYYCVLYVCTCTVHGKILVGEKLATLANRELFTKPIPTNIHRYTENVFGIIIH